MSVHKVNYDLNKEYNVLHHSGRLFQQYVVDKYAQIESQRLEFLKYNQSTLRAELYNGLEDHIRSGDHERVGRRTILPSTYIGGPRNMASNYQDCMALVKKFGKPDLFVTMTTNPKWDEIQEAIYPGQTAQDRPDIVARVFKLKLEELIHEVKKGCFGQCKAFSYNIEFQKRGLPHAHILSF